MIRICALAVACMFHAIPAYAVNKCTDPKTGQVTYSDAPCASGAVKQPPPDLRANLVEGDPDGDRSLRREALRSAQLRESIERGQVALGMREAEVLASWGQPSTVNTSVYESGTTKQWVYPRAGTGVQYVYTRDGVVTAVQTRPDISHTLPGANRPGPCYSDQAIRNAYTSASSITLSPERRREMLDRIAKMRPC